MTNRNISNREAYDKIARIYAGDEPAEEDPRMRKECRKLFTDALKGKDVLEIGCGPGVDSCFLSQEGLNVTATDFSAEFLRIVGERFPNIKTCLMDMTEPDLPKASFDGIYAFASFIHIPRSEAEKTLRGFFNLLKHEGALFLSLIVSSKLKEYIIEDWGGKEGNEMLFTCYKPKEIERLLKIAGFKNIQFYEIKSELYESLPRLVERGVSHFQVLAFA